MPLLSTRGAASSRGFGRFGGSSGWFIDRGLSQPNWSSTGEVYNVGTWDGHYGGATDSFHQYLFTVSRGSNYGTNNWYYAKIMIDGSISIGNTYTLSPTNAPTNSFGGLVDTTRGMLAWGAYNASDIHLNQMPSGMTGLTPGNPAGVPTSASLGNLGTVGYGVSGGNDSHYHNVLQDEYWLSSRGTNTITVRDAATWNLKTTFTLGTATEIYGMCRDPSSGYIVTCKRDSNVYIYHPTNYSLVNTVSTSTSSIEDLVIGWNGDLYVIQSGSTSWRRLARI